MKDNIVYETQLYSFSIKLFKLNIFNLSEVYLENIEYIKYLAKISYGKYKYQCKKDNDLPTDLKMCITELEFETDINIFFVIYDIWIENYIYHQKKSFESYSHNQPLFEEHPDLFDKISKNGKSEYIVPNSLLYLGTLCDQHHNIFLGFKYKFSILEVPESSSFTMETLYDYLFSRYKLIDIKVSPYNIHSIQDTSSYCRSGVIQPINPKCLNHFVLSKKFTGGYYDYSYPNPKYKGLRTYMIEYLLLKKTPIENKRLEVIIKHRKNDMSMMLEEIYYDEFHQQVVGKCIHLDIIDAFGEDITQMNLNHIDLAINIYINENKYDRLNQRISDGTTVTDADYRTHLLRLAEIPFLDVLKIIYLFMDSKSLVIDWIDNQFGDSINISDFLV